MKFKKSDTIFFNNDNVYIGPILDRKEMVLKNYSLIFDDNINTNKLKDIKTYNDLLKNNIKIKYISHSKKYDERPDENELMDDLKLIKKIKAKHKDMYIQLLGFKDTTEFDNYEKYLINVKKNYEEKKMEQASAMLDKAFK
tara:strand:+ start:1511 stop:1933 length:423 start_codon:yes stop_codon:yes gene_type:complete